MKTVCVFTPTFNRAYTLGRLYESLKRQTCRNFSWLIVDDGSTDNTESLISSFIGENEIDITYKKVSNGGKQRAQDLAVKLCQNELFFVLDSDDYLVDRAIEIIVREWANLRNRSDIAGILALKGRDQNHPLGTWMPNGIIFSRQWDLYRSGFKGDISLIYRTDILRKYPHEVEAGETFIPETYVYYRIDEEYTCRLVNEILTICEYLPDGYSHAFPRNVIDSPKCYYKHKKLCMNLSEGPIQLLKNTVLYLVACHMCGRRDGLRNAKSIPIAVIAWLPARLLSVTYFRKR